MIYNGQEVGNQVLSTGPWDPVINWNANPDADQFRSFYTKLIHVRTDYPILSAGAIVPVNSSEARVAAFARTMNGADPILVVINFSDTPLNATLNVTPQMVGLRKSYYLVDLVGSGTGATTAYTGVLKISFEPYQAHVYLLTENLTASLVVSYSIQGGGAPTAPMFNYVQTGVSKTYQLTSTPTRIQVDPGSSWYVTPDPLSGSSGTQRWQAISASLSGGVSSSTTLVFTFYHQYPLKLSGLVIGGGTGYTAPTFTANQYGVAAPQTLWTSAATYWFDAGSSWTVPNPLTGSSSSEQWFTTQKTSGTLTGSGAYAFNYQHQYYLTMQPVNPPGTGSASPSSGWLNAGQNVGIKATAKPGYRLLSWTGVGAGSYSASSPSVTITMNAPITETANFGVLIIITSNPTGSGYLLVDGAAVKSPQTFAWVIGSTHTIAANTPVSCGNGCQYIFASWSDGGAQSHTITVPGAPTTYNATFQKQYLLTITVNPTGGGTVNVSSGWYNAGQKLLLAPIASAGYTFKSWTGKGSGSYTGTNPTPTITMNGTITETANFT
jgi:hypothetical protein